MSSKTKSNPTTTSFALCMGMGDTTITSAIEESGNYYKGSLSKNYFNVNDGEIENEAINLKELLKNFGLEIEEPIDNLLDVNVKNLEFCWFKSKPGAFVEAGWLRIYTDKLDITLVTEKENNSSDRQILVTISSVSELDEDGHDKSELNLAKLMPLVDVDDLPPMTLKKASIIYASKGIDASKLIDKRVPDELKDKFYNTATPGFSLAVEIELDDLKVPLQLPLKRSNSTKRAKAQATGSGGTSVITSTTEQSHTSESVGRTLGPIIVNGLGLSYKESDLVLEFDGALKLSNFQMYLMDMQIALNFNALMEGNLSNGLKFDLSGLYLDLETKGFSMGGGLIRQDIGGRDEYSGKISLKTKALTLTALGAYSQLENGEHSLFAYLALNYPIGGDPAFFVEGLALGFGYNRGVLVPPISEINNFPLVTALDDDDNADTSKIADAEAMELVRQRLADLGKYIPAISGQYLVCAGIKFNTYKQVDSIAVLMVEFGQELGIHMVGLSDMKLPMGIPNAVVSIEMAYRISFDTSEGVVSLEARLTDNSYILSRHCKLTGGFAFYSWFSGDHKGDFVVSMGGYHPSFAKPDHYPSVPRIGFNWQLNKELSFKGEMYAALTPIAIMAGGGVSASYYSRRVRAAFIADMNFIIYWDPFAYDANFYISVSAKVKFWWWFSTEIGASLHVWGPDFAVVAKINWSIFKFTIRYNDTASKSLDPITWSKFHEKHIPQDQTKIIELSIPEGERALINGGSLIDPDNFKLQISSLVPSNQISLNSENYYSENRELNIAPMGGTNGGTVKDWKIVVNVKNGNGEDSTSFVIKPEDKRYPKAVWGDSFKPDLTNKEMTIERLSGAVIVSKPKSDKFPGFSEAINLSEINAIKAESVNETWGWASTVQGNIDYDDGENRETMETTLCSDEVSIKRESIADFFNIEKALSVNTMQENIQSAFIGVPSTFSASSS